MSEQHQQNARVGHPEPSASPLRILAGLYMEWIILAFCALVLSATGKTEGPVYDVVGPDFLPTTVAWIVAALTLVQVVRQVIQQRRLPVQDSVEPLEQADILTGLLFGVVTAAYVLVLAYRLAPFYLLTAVFITLATLLISRRFDWRDALTGIVLGVVLGIILQLIFTRVLVIDLPT